MLLPTQPSVHPFAERDVCARGPTRGGQHLHPFDRLLSRKGVSGWASASAWTMTLAMSYTCVGMQYCGRRLYSFSYSSSMFGRRCWPDPTGPSRSTLNGPPDVLVDPRVLEGRGHVAGRIPLQLFECLPAGDHREKEPAVHEGGNSRRVETCHGSGAVGERLREVLDRGDTDALARRRPGGSSGSRASPMRDCSVSTPTSSCPPLRISLAQNIGSSDVRAHW